MRRAKLKVLIADDHALVRWGIQRLLRDEQDIECVEEVDSAGQALQLVRTGQWDVLILDINMPGQNALEVLRIIKSEKPGLPVLVLSMHEEQQYALRAVRAGASGYVTKASAPDSLITAIRKVTEGRVYLSASVEQALVMGLGEGSTADKPADELLSEREYAVLCAIAKGKRLAKIAVELNLSAKTVSTYRTRVLEKLGAQSNADLVRYAMDRNLTV